MVTWAEQVHALRRSTDPPYLNARFDDRLWMLACAGTREEADRRPREGYGNDSILRDLFRMGQLDWDDVERPSQGNTRSFRYTAALGQELLARIEATETKVSGICY
jgi:hypothetical protein